MSIADKLTQLATIRSNIRQKLTEKGVEATEHNFSDFATDIESIETGITPTGSINITENGTYDVTDKAEAVVDVSGSSDLPICAAYNTVIKETVTVGENTVTNGALLAQYFKGEHKYVIAFMKTLNIQITNHIAYVASDGGDNGTMIRYRGTYLTVRASAGYDAVLVPNTEWEVYLYD